MINRIAQKNLGLARAYADIQGDALYFNHVYIRYRKDHATVAEATWKTLRDLYGNVTADQLVDY